MTGPDCSSVVDCLWSFQALLTGVLAILAAVITAHVIYRAAKLPVRAEEKHKLDLANRRRRLGCLELSSNFWTISERAVQAQSTVRVHKGENAGVSKDTLDRLVFGIPAITQDWEFMSLLSEELAQRCCELCRKIESHNYDMERTGVGSAFGADNFAASITKRLADIKDIAFDLSNELTKSSEK